MSSRMAWRTVGKVGCGGGPLILFPALLLRGGDAGGRLLKAKRIKQRPCSWLSCSINHRVDHTQNEANFLEGMKAFAETDPGFPPGSQYSTKDHPIQSFQWADYTAKPGHKYTYTVTALKGSPTLLTPHATTLVNITAESPEGGTHDVYFNRGVAGSQAYVRRFGDRAPDKVPNRQAFIWLSRGLNEALEDFVRSSVPGRHAFRIAAYEF